MAKGDFFVRMDGDDLMFPDRVEKQINYLSEYHEVDIIEAVANLDVYREILDYYSTLHFINPDRTFNVVTVVKHTSRVLCCHGLRNVPAVQTVAGINIYPYDYFNPFDNATGKMMKTANTRSIHWYSMTWIENKNPIRTFATRLIHRVFGVNSLAWLKALLKKL